MALMTCPDCGGKVSSEATSCPHCGYNAAVVLHGREVRRARVWGAIGCLFKLAVVAVFAMFLFVFLATRMYRPTRVDTPAPDPGPVAPAIPAPVPPEPDPVEIPPPPPAAEVETAEPAKADDLSERARAERQRTIELRRERLRKKSR